MYMQPFSLKPPIYTFFFLRHGGIYFWVLRINKTINEIMTSTCYIIKLWLMWYTSNWLQHPKRVFKKHINDMLSWTILIIVDNVYKGFSFSAFTIVTLILIVTFWLHTAGLHHCLRVKHDRDIWLSRTQTWTTPTGTVELRFLKLECLQSDNMTTDLYHNVPPRDQFHPLTRPIMLFGSKPTNHEQGLWYTNH